MKEEIILSYEFEEHQLNTKTISILDPRKCSHCGETGLQKFIFGATSTIHESMYSTVTVYGCPLCGELSTHYMENDEDENTWSPIYAIPREKSVAQNFSKEIRENFPDFVEIFSQSIAAEREGLKHLAGMGFRKALEFLVTDFLLQYPVSDTPTDWLKNPKTKLSEKIMRLKSERLQTFAKATSYLGNDETHYTKIHTNYDIQNMKSFITLIIQEIEGNIHLQHAMEIIQK